MQRHRWGLHTPVTTMAAVWCANGRGDREQGSKWSSAPTAAAVLWMWNRSPTRERRRVTGEDKPRNALVDPAEPDGTGPPRRTERNPRRIWKRAAPRRSERRKATFPRRFSSRLLWFFPNGKTTVFPKTSRYNFAKVNNVKIKTFKPRARVFFWSRYLPARNVSVLQGKCLGCLYFLRTHNGN